MCGIVGYIGEKQAAPILLKGLEKLEYRGYDSSGIAVMTGEKITMHKAKGRLNNLATLIDNGNSLQGSVGIGHTRWATHGEPSDINSHPHISPDGRFAVVHNGIIENYLELKSFLTDCGYSFLSQTDTEVISLLLHYYFDGDILGTIIKTLNRLKGSYALGILALCEQDKFYAVKKDSPLVIGLGNNANFIASDMPAVLEHTKKFILLGECEIACITKSDVQVYNINCELVSKEPFIANWDIEAAEKAGYPHFMLKEIFEQPKAIEATLNPRIKDGEIVLDGITLTKEQLQKINKINIIACGSAYHAAVVGKYFIEKLCRINVETDVASEFRYRSPLIDERTLTIVISQSGETADTLAALKKAKSCGSRVISIVNVVGSSVARLSDDVLYTWAGPEIAVATTKGYTTQILSLYLIGLYIAKMLGSISQSQYEQLLLELKSIPKKMDTILKEQTPLLQQLASHHYNAFSTFFIGRGSDYAAAMEGALKLKEISYIHAQAYPAGELKHGTISLIEDNSLVIALATDESLCEKTLSNIKEVKTRGACVVAIVDSLNTTVQKEVDSTFYLPPITAEFSPLLSAVILQLISYYIALEKGCDIDKPKNLAKSVTVE